MIALLQRVATASVSVENETVAAIGAGLLVYVALQPQDDEAILMRMGERVLAYRVFADDAERMNLGVEQAKARCCWSRSSRWPPAPARDCVRASRRRLPPNVRRYCSSSLQTT